MRRMTVVDFRVFTPDGLILPRPVFDFEVKHSSTWHRVCTDDWIEASEAKVFPFHFKNGRRMAWAAGRAFDTRAINSFAMANVDWEGSSPVTLFGDIIVRMPNRLWPCTWVSMGSWPAREHLRDVQMDDVAVLSTCFVRRESGCLIAARDTNRLSMAKLAVG